jgi:hypothetical protein
MKRTCLKQTRLLRFFGAFLLVLPTHAAQPDPAAFTRIEPLLRENCFKCHSHSADKIKAGLVVDSLAGLLQGGDRGPAVIPGDVEGSLLIKAVRYTDPDLQMPPRGKQLSMAQIKDLEEWVKLGAPWPPSNKKPERSAKFTDEDRQWWAFQPVRPPPVPEVHDGGWSRSPVDKFVFQKLAAEGLTPSPEADRAALARRLYFDLWGLPPAPEELDRFLADESPEACEKLIDHLLASPHYGERWARHWLDLVRYAESDGYRIDDYRPHAWPYRDYVIRSFNTDKPYDRFVREQLAGDEIDPGNPEMLVANSFLRHGIYEYNNRDARGHWTTILNDVTDVTSDIFLGLGLQCARCHNHKFDPILQRDYYRFQAFFAPMLPRQDLVLATARQRAEYEGKLAKWNELTSDIRRQIDEIESVYRDKARVEAIIKFPEDIQAMIHKPKAERTPYEHQIAELAWRQVTHEYVRLDTRIKSPDKEKLAALRQELARYDSDKPEPLPPAFTVTDVGPTAPAVFIPKGGNRESIEPGYLTLLEEKPARIRPVGAALNSTGRRSELARWLTQPDNPLATRVIVNRIWQYHFGRGLVATASDFGRLGERPTHPELLDWLATRFVKDGWSFKKMHRLILASSVYRQSATAPPPEAARMKDPENRWLWRMNNRRLDSEQIRDALLAVSGELDLTMGGASVDVSNPRRTIYTKVMRNTRDPLLDAFDAPEGFASTAQRNVTTTPTQALLMFNSATLLQRAKALAGRLQQLGLPDPDRVGEAYRLAFGRKPTDEEQAAGMRFLREQAGRIPTPRATTIAFVSDKMPYREGKAALLSPSSPMHRFEVACPATKPTGEFTIEAFILLKSVYEDGSVRTIAAQWDGDKAHSGWALGVTGRQSKHKPQTLVLQLNDPSGSDGGYEAVFSGLHIDLNKPYFIAAAVQLSQTNENGVIFYTKDLSNDDEPMQVARIPHQVTALRPTEAMFTMGGRQREANHFWDGLLDDVRLSTAALRQEQLLLTSEAVNEQTVGYWQFETPSTYRKDGSGRGHDIQPRMALPSAKADPKAAALADFCQVLLNANEFLYVD